MIERDDSGLPPPPEPPDRPPTIASAPGPPVPVGPPWKKIAVFGCLGLLVLGLLLAVAGFFVYRHLRERDELMETFLEDRRETGGPAVVGEGRQVFTGTLGPGDPTREDGSYYEEWTFEASPGARVVVRLESQAFDPYLTVFAPSGTTYSDDDSGGGNNARLEITTDEGGTWRVWANSYAGGATGDYRLTIER
jgi:hypothetical protein